MIKGAYGINVHLIWIFDLAMNASIDTVIDALQGLKYIARGRYFI